MFDGLKKNGAQWDVIEMSLYPPSNKTQREVINKTKYLNMPMSQFSQGMV